jgi:hypothetical protein
MKNAAPPSIGQCSKTSPFLIGKNSRGNWVVQDQQGLRGGLFIGRAEALRYAMFENGNRPQAAIMVPGVLELNTSGDPLAPHSLPSHGDTQRKLQMA